MSKIIQDIISIHASMKEATDKGAPARYFDDISIHASMKEATKRCPRCHKRILEGGDYAEEIQTEEYGEGGDLHSRITILMNVYSDRGVW